MSSTKLSHYEPVGRTKPNPNTVDIATGGGHLYRRAKNGSVSVYYGSVYSGTLLGISKFGSLNRENT